LTDTEKGSKTVDMKNKEFAKFLKLCPSRKEAAKIMGVKGTPLISMIAADKRNVTDAVALRIVKKFPQLDLRRMLTTRIQ
jgi:plasmid maintenance system antidote protein VapI